MPAAIMFPLLTTGHYAGGKWEMGVVEVVWVEVCLLVELS